jgi:predicted metal-binding membrane protein
MTKAAVNAVLRRDRAIVIVVIAGLTILAWAYILWLAAHADMPGMPASEHGGMEMPGVSMRGAPMPMAGMTAVEPAFRAWSAADFAFMFAMWAVMMVGMMMPSMAPMVLLYAAVGRKAAASGRPLAATGWFIVGYLLVWIGFSLAATGAQWTLTRLALLTPTMASTSDIFGGAVLVATGLYQWSPLKDTCLGKCQLPLGFLISRGGFRSSPVGSLRLGAEHGAYCVGCCWMLVALLFVGGVMNVLWIAGLAILVLLEKVVPAGRLISRTAGAVMVAAGLFLANVPEQLGSL